MSPTIATANESDVRDLLPLLRGYCDFYRVHPPDEQLLALCRALIERPEDGTQLIARGEDAEALGFATVYWTWDTLVATRVGVLNDLYVKPAARGRGAGRALIEACVERAREQGAAGLQWQTEPRNTRAQRLYESVGAERSEWVGYWLETRGR
jgi:ribosomal protein S18 acetylase RimI-like enzyme